MLRTGANGLLVVLTAGLFHLAGTHTTALDLVPVAADGTTLNVSRYEVTVAEWDACVTAGACEDIAATVADPRTTPMTGVNWFDVDAYITWYNGKHGRKLRLPTATEWRAISGMAEPVPQKPLFDDPRLAWAANYGQEETPGGPVRPQGAWSRSKDGVRDLDGNVWEWTASCMDTQQAGVTTDRCPAFKAMGAHTATVSVFVRNPAAGGCSSGKPPTHIGFRLVEDMGEPQS